MYIKIGNKKINCTDFNVDDGILFYLKESPVLNNDKIYLYTDDDFCMRTIVRSEYKYEKITEFGEEFILTLTNEEEITPSLDDYKSDKIKELSFQAEEAIINGFDLEVNGDTKHFSLEAHDQRNISNICQYLYEHQDIEGYLYHADNENIETYSRDILFNIRDIMLQTITEYTQKYNIAKQKINKAVTIDDIKNIVL